MASPTALGTGYPIAANMPNLSGVVIPVWWKKLFLKFFYAALILDKITTNSYQEIKGFGDRIIVPSLPDDVGITDYVDGMDIPVSQVSMGFKELFINQGVCWAFIVSDVQLKQAGWSWDAPMAEHYAKKMKQRVESKYLNANYTTGDAFNMGASAGYVSRNINLGVAGTPRQFGPANAVMVLSDCRQVLSENNVEEDRFYMAAPPVITKFLINSELKLAYETGDPTSPIRSGLVGHVNKFDIYETNLITPIADSSGVNCYPIMFGHKEAVSFATQMEKVEQFRSPTQFGDIRRSLLIYGYKTFLPRALGMLYAYPYASAAATA